MSCPLRPSARSPPPSRPPVMDSPVLSGAGSPISEGSMLRLGSLMAHDSLGDAAALGLDRGHSDTNHEAHLQLGVALPDPLKVMKAAWSEHRPTMLMMLERWARRAAHAPRHLRES
mmetsp:Transcript_5765/g.17609  ORF Transcript_5765/g.17609 Transcript_5765/m.17609 type:complete len:116 (-) Transcript_5765:311-658(-)